MIAFIKLNTEKAKEEPWLEELCEKDRKKKKKKSTISGKRVLIFPKMTFKGGGNSQVSPR